MTREEAIEVLETVEIVSGYRPEDYPYHICKKAFDMAVEALKKDIKKGNNMIETKEEAIREIKIACGELEDALEMVIKFLEGVNE